jgi:hypothetical protein
MPNAWFTSSNQDVYSTHHREKIVYLIIRSLLDCIDRASHVVQRFWSVFVQVCCSSCQSCHSWPVGPKQNLDSLSELVGDIVIFGLTLPIYTAELLPFSKREYQSWEVTAWSASKGAGCSSALQFSCFSVYIAWLKLILVMRYVLDCLLCGCFPINWSWPMWSCDPSAVIQDYPNHSKENCDLITASFCFRDQMMNMLQIEYLSDSRSRRSQQKITWSH